MKLTQITHKTAILAKEKGFDVGNDNADSYTNEGTITRASFLNYAEICYAPSQSLLQKWLREKHRLNVFTLPNRYDSDVWYYAIGGVKTVVTAEETTDPYEEALEKGLQEALKLIK